MRLEAFVGLWRLERSIEDIRGGRSGELRGTAQFSLAPGGLAYSEEGMLRLGDAAPVRATRAYLWRDGGAGTIELRFEDGRMFHRFYADEPQPVAVHECPPDRYRVRYDFGRWPRWRADWRVRGPRKDYAMVSAYAPAGQGAPDAASPGEPVPEPRG